MIVHKDKFLLAGIASYVYGDCGPDITNGMAFQPWLSGYVDVFHYVEWIEKKQTY